MADQTTRIYMVRHGETQLSAEDRFAGAVDVELSGEGRFQAERLAERLADDSIRAVYCSPHAHGSDRDDSGGPHQPLVHEDGLREIHHGHWEDAQGRCRVRIPGEYAAWRRTVHLRAARRRRC